jgi:hypothetical protein
MPGLEMKGRTEMKRVLFVLIMIVSASALYADSAALINIIDRKKLSQDIDATNIIRALPEEKTASSNIGNIEELTSIDTHEEKLTFLFLYQNEIELEQSIKEKLSNEFPINEEGVLRICVEKYYEEAVVTSLSKAESSLSLFKSKEIEQVIVLTKNYLLTPSEKNWKELIRYKQTVCGANANRSFAISLKIDDLKKKLKKRPSSNYLKKRWFWDSEEALRNESDNGSSPGGQ